MARMELEELKIDDSIYPRTRVSGFNVQRMISALEAGLKLPPIVIEAEANRIVDGRHRYEAYSQQGLKTIDVTKKSYASEADIYADAVRLNTGHGEPLDQFSIRNAIIRLEKYGYEREKISDIVRLPVEQIEKIERGFAQTQSGEPVALKGGLSHLKGRALDKEQLEVNKHYSGGKASFYVRQITNLLSNDMWPDQSADFIAGMDRLVELWREVRAKKKSDAA